MWMISQLLLLQLAGQIIAWSPSSNQCTAVEADRVDCGFPGISDTACMEKSCCWVPCEGCAKSVPWCFHAASLVEECVMASVNREDCGSYGIDRDECEERGCCWAPTHESNTPWCYIAGSTGQPFTTPQWEEETDPARPVEEGDRRYLYGNSGTVRLTSHIESSFAQPTGLVEVSNNGRWGTVCDDGMDTYTINVICADFDHVKGYRIPVDDRLIQHNDPIFLDDVHCTGDESSLTECEHAGWEMENCNHSEDIAVTCYSQDYPTDEEGSIRLVDEYGTVASSSGILEVQHDGIWGTICHLNNERTAHFLCLKLGFVTGTYTSVQNLYPSYESTKPVWLDYISCYQEIDTVTDCLDYGGQSWGTASCEPAYSIALNCVGGGDSDIEDGTLRLAEGGELEVAFHGIWGHICSENFGYSEAEVACRNLGSTGGTILSPSYNGEESVINWFAGLTCTGNEDRLVDCLWSTGPAECYTQSVAIECGPLPEKEPGYEGEIRLFDGDSEDSGRVEIIHNGSWGTVCEDSVTKVEIQVICQQLGYESGSNRFSRKGGRPGTPIHLDSIDCSGDEEKLVDCYHAPWGEHDCDHHEDLDIQCGSSDYTSYDYNSGDDIQVRLTGGSSSREGRVEVNIDRAGWGTVCDDLWDDRDANATCRQLGYQSGVSFGASYFGEGTGEIRIDSTQCGGWEEKLSDCRFNKYRHDCTHAEDAGVACA